jgi:hypothetical protein
MKALNNEYSINIDGYFSWENQSASTREGLQYRPYALNFGENERHFSLS